MRKARGGVIAIVAVTAGLALAGCGSGDERIEAPTSSSTTSSPPATPGAPAQTKPNKSIPDYIRENGITETLVKRGDPGSPEINLPVPPGWEDMGPETPQWAWSGMKFTADPGMAANPPTILALLSKLQGNVDPSRILELAPGEMRNLPGYEGDGVGMAGTLGGFDSWQVSGMYTRDGVKRAVAQKTVTIPAGDGLLVLQINYEGAEDQMGVLMEAAAAIDEQTTITPAP